MKLLICFLFCLCLFISKSFLFAEEQAAVSSYSQNILFLMRAGEVEKSIDSYKKYCQVTGVHDFELLQQIAQQFLEQGLRTKEPQVQLLSLFGAGIAANEKLLAALEEGLSSPFPQIQLIALHFLARYQNDDADGAIHRAMSSNFLPIRFEAAYYLAQKKYPTALGQIEALMHKVDKELLVIFPQLFAMIGDPAAMRILRKMMHDPNVAVRIEAILSAAKYGRDDLLPQVRTLAMQLNIAQQEACAIALRIFQDESSLDRLEQLARSPALQVRLAANHTLYSLGKKGADKSIEQVAREGDPFAIALLQALPGTEELLYSLTTSPHLQVRVNASLSLLEKQDPRCIKGILELLIRDSRDLAFVKISSLGKGLSAWKAVPSAQQQLASDSYLLEASVTMREALLCKASHLPEKEFLQIANELFDAQQNELIPTLVLLLQELKTPLAIELLKKQQQKMGAPLIRNYCGLALYRLGEADGYEEKIKSWIAQQQQTSFIQLRPLMPWEQHLEEGEHSSYQLTPKETSSLLIESIEALATQHNEVSIEVLLNAIQQGHPMNRTVLAGLLMRATQ